MDKILKRIFKKLGLITQEDFQEQLIKILNEIENLELKRQNDIINIQKEIQNNHLTLLKKTNSNLKSIEMGLISLQANSLVNDLKNILKIDSK